MFFDSHRLSFRYFMEIYKVLSVTFIDFNYEVIGFRVSLSASKSAVESESE